MKESTIRVNSKMINQMRRLIAHTDCDHDWKIYGLGHKCEKCDYYSGTDEELNKIIESEKP